MIEAKQVNAFKIISGEIELGGESGQKEIKEPEILTEKKRDADSLKNN